MNNKKVDSPAAALNYLNEQLPMTLKSKIKTGQINDGMEAGICVINKTKNKLYFAGANLNLIHIRKGIVDEIKGDKHSIGLNIEQQKVGSVKSLLRSKLLGSGMISLLIKVSGAGLSYLMFVAFAHLLNAQDYGVFAFSFNLAVVVSAFAGFGYSTAIMRYWPKYLAQGLPEYANGAIRWAHSSL